MPVKNDKPNVPARESHDTLRERLRKGEKVSIPRSVADKFLRWLEGSTGTPDAYTIELSGQNAVFLIPSVDISATQ